MDEYIAGTDPNQAPLVEIIVDNLDPQATSVGSWQNSSATQVFNTNSVYALIGGSLDQFPMTYCRSESKICRISTIIF